MSDINKDREFETEDPGGPIPPRPLPDYVEVFSQSARLIDGLPEAERVRVVSALLALFDIEFEE